MVLLNKTFELRKDDRNFEVGDTLRLMEYEPVLNQYTGRFARRKIIGILKDCPEYGLMKGYCILSLSNFV